MAMAASRTLILLVAAICLICSPESARVSGLVDTATHADDVEWMRSHDAYACDETYPEDLSVGFWVGAPGAVPGSVVWAKACPLDRAGHIKHFDPEKDTEVFFHGAQPDYVRENIRTWLERDGQSLAALVLAAGRNIVIFQSTQFLDVPITHAVQAEGRIWDPTYFGMMRWKRLLDGKEIDVRRADPSETIVDIAVRHYRNTFGRIPPQKTGDGQKETVTKFVGHSLGSQIAILAAHRLNADPNNARPVSMVVALDPVFSPDAKMYLYDYKTPLGNQRGSTILATLESFIEDLLAQDVPTMIIKTTSLNRWYLSSQRGSDISKLALVLQVVSNKWGDRPPGKAWTPELLADLAHYQKKRSLIHFQLVHQHSYAVIYYFSTLFAAPHECLPSSDFSECSPTPTLIPGAATPPDLVLSFVRNAYRGGTDTSCYHTFDNGARDDSAPTMTVSPADDLFYMHACKTVNA